MKLYATYGTYGYLNQIRVKHPEHPLLQFSAPDSSVIFEETDDKTVLKQPIVYDVVNATGELDEDQFFSVLFIPTSEDHAYQLENKLKNISPDFSQFASRRDYEDFKQSATFQENFAKSALSQFFGSSGQHSSYFERYLFPIEE